MDCVVLDIDCVELKQVESDGGILRSCSKNNEKSFICQSR